MSESTRLGISIQANNTQAQASIQQLQATARQLQATLASIGGTAQDAGGKITSALQSEINSINQEIAARRTSMTVNSSAATAQLNQIKAVADAQMNSASKTIASSSSAATAQLTSIKAVANGQMEASARADAAVTAQSARSIAASASASLSQLSSIKAVANAQVETQARAEVAAQRSIAAHAGAATAQMTSIRAVANAQMEATAKAEAAEETRLHRSMASSAAASMSQLNSIRSVANARMEAAERGAAAEVRAAERSTAAQAGAALAQLASIKAVADARMRATLGAAIGGGSGAAGSLVQNEARHVVALFDEMASNRRGAFISTLGASARDAGLGVAGLTASVAALAAVMGTAAILHHAEALGKWATETRAAASATGMSLESYSQLQGALALTGLKGEEADATLRRLAINLGTAMSDPVSLVAQAFHNLGISQAQITSTGSDVEKALHLLADAFARTQDGANKSAAMNEIFGREFEKIILAIQHGGDALDILKSKAQALGITLTNDSAKKLEETGHRIDELEQKIRGKGIQAFVDWSTSISAFTKSLSTAIDSIGTLLGWIGKMEAAKIDVAKWIFGRDQTPTASGAPGRGNISAESSALIDTTAKSIGMSQIIADLGTKIAYAESRGRQFDDKGNVIKSEDGALGMMQVMPDKEGGTTRTLAGKVWDLTDPVQNVKAGLIYLAEQFRTFGGDLSKTALAYHSGPGNVLANTIGPKGRAYVEGMNFDDSRGTPDLGKEPVPPLVKGGSNILGLMREQMAEARNLATKDATTPKQIQVQGDQAEINVMRQTLKEAQLTAKERIGIEAELNNKIVQLRSAELGASISASHQATQDFIAKKKEEIAEANGSASKIASIYDEMLSGLRTRYSATAAQILTIEREKTQAINHARMEEMRNQTQLDERTIRQNRVSGELAQIASGRFKFAGQSQQGLEADVQRSQEALQEAAMIRARAQARINELETLRSDAVEGSAIQKAAASEIVQIRLQATTQEVSLLKEAGNAAVMAANKIAAPFVNMFNQIGSQTEQFASSMITAFLAPQKEIIKRGLTSSTVLQQGAEVRAAAKTLFLGITQDLAKSLATSLSHMAASALSGGVSNTIGELLGNMLSKAVGSIFGSAAGSAVGNLLGGGAGSIAGSAGVVTAVGAGATATVTGVTAAVAASATTVVSAIAASSTAIVAAISGTSSVEDALLGSISVQQPSIAGFSLAGGGIIPSAAGGMVSDGKGGTLAVLHPKEMVLPASISDGLQGMIRGSSSSSSANTTAQQIVAATNTSAKNNVDAVNKVSSTQVTAANQTTDAVKAVDTTLKDGSKSSSSSSPNPAGMAIQGIGGAGSVASVGIAELLQFGVPLAFARGGVVPSAAGGMMVGGTGASLAILHAQEMVLPSPISRGIQEMIGRGGSGGNSSNSSANLNYSPTINTGPKGRGGTGLTRSEFSQMMSSHGGSMFGEMRTLMNNGWRPA